MRYAFLFLSLPMTDDLKSCEIARWQEQSQQYSLTAAVV